MGAGNSATKKEAQFNAARDFVNYLQRTGQVDSKEVPEDVRVKQEDLEQQTGPAPGNIQNDYQRRPVFQVKSIF